MQDSEESPVTSVDRALRILTAIGEASRGLSLDELWGACASRRARCTASWPR